MADVNANIGVHIDTSGALAGLKNLQRQLATFHSSIAQGSAASAAAQKGLQTNLLNSINATGQFTARMGVVRTSTESFTHALEKNKLTMRDYYRYAGASTKTFGRLFKSEYATINKVAEERVRKMQTQYIKMGRDASGAMKAMAITPTSLNMKDYATQTALAAQKQALFNQVVRQGSTNLLNFGKNTQWAGRQLMVGFSVPLMYIGAAAASTFMKLEAQAVRFKRVYGEMFTTTEETNKALKDIELLAKSFTKYGVTVEETMKMAADAAAMGKMGADLTQQVANATKLAVLGGVEQEKALETTISLTNAFGIATEDLTNKINFLNAVENQTVTSIEDLTIAVPKAGPVIQQLGGSVEDLAFFLTAMREGGINASEGANALKSGLASLINPTKKASEMLAGYGINVKGIVEGNAGNIKNTVVQFAQALDTLAPLDRARAIEQMFGKFQFARLSTLFQNITKDGTQANRVLNLTNSTVEELAILSEREMAKVEDAVGTKFKASVESLKVSLAPVGKAFLEAVTPIVQFLGKLFKRFGDMDEGVQKFVTTVSALVGILGPVLLMTFGLVANGVANIIKLFLAMRIGINKIGGNTTILAEQTSYLNAEQLEAATVAASLNQAHTQLTQRFQLETTAVQALRAAYIEATVAAAAFARANPGAMIGGGRGPIAPKKFAKGTTSVPGSGTGDTVPSMLTPGEAVIPRDVAQNPIVQPTIDAMVSGNLEGFEGGFNGTSARSSASYRGTHNLIMGRSGFDNGTLSKPNPTKSASPEVKRAFAHAVDFRQVSGGAVSEKFRALGFGKENLYTAVGFDIPKEMNSKLNNGQVPLGEYRQAIQHPEALRTMTSRLIASGLPPKEAHAVAKTIRNNFLKSTKGIPGTQAITDKFVYSRMGNEKTGIMGALAKSKNPAVAKGARTLLAAAASSPVGKSSITMNSTRPISEIISKVKGTKTSQSVIKALENVRTVDPNIKLPVKLDANGNIVAFQRPEVEKGMLSKTQNLGVLNGDKFETGRLSRGGGRQVTVTGAASKQFDRLIKKRIAKQEKVVAVQKGEHITDNKGKTKKVTGANTKPRPAGITSNTGRGVDTRLATIKPGYRITPRGMMPGYEGGVNTGTGVPLSSMPGQWRAEQNSLRRQLEKQEKRRMYQMRQEEKLRQQQSDSIKRQLKLEQEQIKAHNQQVIAGQKAKQALNGFSSKAGMGIGALSGMAIAATFAGGSIGKMAQSIMPALFGIQALTMLLPLMTKWSGLIGLAVTSFAVAGFVVKQMSNKARAAMLDLADQTGITANGLKRMSEFSNKVTAFEQMQYRSRQRFNPFLVQPGKTSFGSNFAASEQGAEIMKGLKTIMTQPQEKGMGTKEAADALMSQLSAAVASGIFTVEQARSVAVQIGQELNNVPLGLKVNAQLSAVFGPDGQNLLNSKGELEVNLVAKETAKAQKQAGIAMGGNSAYQNGVGAMDRRLATTGIIGTFTAAGLLAGGLAAGGATATGVGAIIAPIAGVVTGLVAGTVASIKLLGDSSKKLAASSASAIASFTGAIELQNQIAAQLDIYYQKEIAAAEAAGNTAKANELRSKYAAKSAKIEEQGFKTRQAAIDAFIKSRGNTEAALLQATKDKVDRIYKGTSEEDYVKQAKSITKTVSGVTEFGINLAMSSKSLAPSTVVALADIIGTDKKEWTTILNIDTRFGGTMAQDTANVINAIGDKETGMVIAYQVKQAGDKKAADDLIQVYGAVSQLSGEFDVNVIANYLVNNPEAFAQLNLALDAIEKNKGKLEFDIVSKYLQLGDPEQFIKDQAFFKGLDQNERYVYTQTVATVLSVPDPQVIAGNDFKVWRNEDGPYGGKQFEGQNHSKHWWAGTFANFKAKRFVIENPALVEMMANPSDSSGEKKQRDTTFDSILNDLKRTRDATINATGGAKELMRILSGKKDLQFFKGIDQQLSKIGANSDFIEFIGGLEKAIQNKLIKVNKKGVASLTELGKAAKKAYDEKQLGLFSAKSANAITEAQKQRQGFLKLKSAGVETADAVEMVADATFMVSLAAQKNPKEIKRMISEWKTMKKEMNLTTASTNPQEYFDSQRAIAEKQLDFQESMARRTYEPQIAAAEKLVEANNVLIEQNQRKLEMDENIGSRKIDSINAEIDSLNRQLATGIDKTIQGLQDQSSKLSEDQTIISHAVDAINEKYDLQEQALSKISELNQEIIAEKKTQISLADALTQGDISAAAQAAEDARAATASRSQRLASDAIAAAKEAEIGAVTGPLTGLTSKQIAESQYLIDRQQYTLSIQRAKIEADIAAKQEEIYKIELLRKPIIAEITRLEDLNYNYNVNIITPLKNKLQAELDAVEAQRQKWTDAQLAIDKADLSSESFKGKLDKANSLLTSISGLWKDITDKNLTLTITKIEKLIQDNAIGTTSAEAISTLKNATTAKEVDAAVKRAAELGGSPSDIANAMIPGLLASGMDAASAAVTARWTGAGLASQKQQEAEAKATPTPTPTPSTSVDSREALRKLQSGQTLTAAEKKVLGMAKGGIVPKYFSVGGFSKGTDTVPAMLTPGEFVVNSKASQKYGSLLSAINTPGFDGMQRSNIGISTKTDAQSAGDMYNYNIGINVTNANANSDDIARAVIGQIKYIDSQRLRGQR